MDLSSKEREGGEVAGVWANGEQLILQVMMKFLQISEKDTHIFVAIKQFVFSKCRLKRKTLSPWQAQ